MSRNKILVPFILVTSLFFLWAFLHNLNPILIPHLRKACQLNDTQSSLVDFPIYLAYCLAAIPAGLFMHKYGYKKGIIFGLIMFAIGALLFTFAASERNFIFFLIALFVQGWQSPLAIAAVTSVALLIDVAIRRRMGAEAEALLRRML